MPHHVSTPLSESDVRQFKVGDELLISGQLILSRDVGHKYMKEHHPTWLEPLLKNMIIYHCGPVVQKQTDGTWKFIAAGPTTSIREEPYQASIINHYSVRGVIGKGGMGKATSDALVKTGSVYLHATGGAGTLLAECVEKVVNVYMLEEFGSPEAFWVVQVKNFPVVVTMDSHGGSLHDVVANDSAKRAQALMKP